MLCLLSLVAGSAAVAAAASASPQIEWLRQFGTAGADVANDVAANRSGVYVAGRTPFVFRPGVVGLANAFVRKYDHDGTLIWIREFGTAVADEARGIDVFHGAVYVVGTTGGSLPGQASAGGTDAFLRKYNATGVLLWTRQFGTVGGDAALAVDVTGNAVYVGGYTAGDLPGGGAGSGAAYIRRYDQGGNQVWTRQFDSSNVKGLASDVSGVSAAGDRFVGGPSGGYVRRYDAGGNEVWTDEFGTAGFLSVNDVANAPDSVYVVGEGNFGTDVEPPNGSAFIRRYTANGVVAWTNQFGSAPAPGGNVGIDVAQAAVADATGVFIGGRAGGTFPGETSAGDQDALVARFSVAGSLLWARQFGTSGFDQALGIDRAGGALYEAGQLGSAFPGQTHLGGDDAFVAKILPETR